MHEWFEMASNAEQSSWVGDKDGFTTIKLSTTTLKNSTVINAIDSQICHLGECVEYMLCNIDSINIMSIIDSSINSDAVPIDVVLDNKDVDDDASINDENNWDKINSLYLINMLDHAKIIANKYCQHGKVR